MSATLDQTAPSLAPVPPGGTGPSGLLAAAGVAPRRLAPLFAPPALLFGLASSLAVGGFSTPILPSATL